MLDVCNNKMMGHHFEYEFSRPIVGHFGPLVEALVAIEVYTVTAYHRGALSEGSTKEFFIIEALGMIMSFSLGKCLLLGLIGVEDTGPVFALKLTAC